MHRRKVLLADDDPSLRQLVATTLGTDSFTSLHAGDGDESLAITRSERPELVLLDVNMPGLNGLEVCAAIKGDERLREIKVVMLTASGNFEDQERARALGADDYFVKPFSPVALLDKIYDLLDETTPSPPE
ncbi:MAG TPA: response regulator [Chloroflexota bacterium]|jgi:DNA-binding response OmpR family regulator|nr:response regulator [Chloroflexota bacterium]